MAVSGVLRGSVGAGENVTTVERRLTLWSRQEEKKGEKTM